tara:strand:- start:465 stop:851 length:387 start_codon:yes stop_codon:yes gene_type:complete
MIDKIKGFITTSNVVIFALVVVLLIVIANKSGQITDLQTSLSDANNTVISRDESIESMSVKHDMAVAILDSAIAGLEASAVDVNARLNDVDTQRGELEYEVARLLDRLNDRQLTINDLMENPNCPVTE